MITALAVIVAVVVTNGTVLAVTMFKRRNRTKPTEYRIKVKFARGIVSKLVLDEQQFEQFTAWMNAKDGYFEIEGDRDIVKLYRENVCAVEVKRR